MNSKKSSSFIHCLCHLRSSSADFLPVEFRYTEACESPSLSVIPDFIWRRVLVKGKWDYAHTMLLSPRVREGVHGVNVVTPLIRENGSTILVDRGFVSQDCIPLIGSQSDTGEVEVLGMLRTSQPRNLFTPDNDPAAGKWYWTDVEGMAEYAGGQAAGVQPVFVQQIFGTLLPSLHSTDTHYQKRDTLEKPIPGWGKGFL